MIRGDPADDGYDDGPLPHRGLDGPDYTLAEVVPSGWLGLELDVTTAVAATLCDADLVDAVVAFDRMTSWASARQARLLAEFSRRRPPDAPDATGCDIPSMTSRFAPDEIGLALRLSRGAAIARLGQSVQLDQVLPATLEAWERGRIDVLKVRAICDTVRVLDDERARLVEARVLVRAGDQSVTQLRASLKRAVIAVDPEGVAARHRLARTDRRVAVGQENDGMASLWALLH